MSDESRATGLATHTLTELRTAMAEVLRYPRNLVLFLTLALVLSAVVFLGGIAWTAASPEVAERSFATMTVGDFFSPVMLKVSLAMGLLWAAIVTVVQRRP